MTNKTPVSLGIIASVDSGKTTLSEAMLYLQGQVRKLGRVDNQDAFLDTYELEKKRGITIFSKLAQLELNEHPITLVDTPGHVDFSAEMERTLQVLDYAVLLVSGADGVQGHTQTLWSLLKTYDIPTFVFINKMDQEGTNREALLAELQEKLDFGCLPFAGEMDEETDEAMDGENGEKRQEWMENLAMCDEETMESFLEEGTITRERVQFLIENRKVFPCYFGSALKLEGVEEFLQSIGSYMAPKQYDKEFGAKVYKIMREDRGSRLTFLKITGGCLKVKDRIGDEKINQIRIYSGAGYQMVNEAGAGTICAVTGLSDTKAGQGLGVEYESDAPILEPVLTYQIILPEGGDVHQTLKQLKELEEEEPMLHIVWNEHLQEIQAQLMGEVQIEILKSLVKERFHLDIEFGTGNIVYHETIKNTVEGVGHYEPLKHYSEVHLLLEPGEPGSGMVYDTDCSEDELDKNWQRLILTHLMEKEHVGVLTGSPITDMKITLVSGRAHLKHTEGGDFRQSTYRAIRQGLMQAESVLLEPFYDYVLEVPQDIVGRAMTDVERMKGTFDVPQPAGDLMRLSGKVSVAGIQGYQTEVTAYTHGLGHLFCTLRGYEPCQNAQEVIEKAGYEPERDLENTPDSIFCAHGAGYQVPWREVPEHMHLESVLERRKKIAQAKEENQRPIRSYGGGGGGVSLTREEERELTPRTIVPSQTRAKTVMVSKKKEKEELEEYLLVDGYNVIFAWEDLKDLAQVNLDAARLKLQDELSNYQGYKKCKLIVVYDAYKIPGQQLTIENYHNIQVVFTKEAQTADAYIERTAHELGRKYHVTVATSDGAEQVIIRGQGCYLLSSRELLEEINYMKEEIRREHIEPIKRKKNYLFDSMDEELAEKMERVRLGEKLKDE